MSTSQLAPAYIIAARRSALGRVGGLHRSRRLEALSEPVVAATLGDAGLTANRVEELIIGNATAGANPARMIALAAGLPETAFAMTVDSQCASSLLAILCATRAVAAGDIGVALAGGAESVSTAPWRIAKPKSLYQIPRFMSLEANGGDERTEPESLETLEALARRFGISREAQDNYAVQSHLRAESARAKRRFVGEIVPIRSTPEEARDQSAIEPNPDAFTSLVPFLPPSGTVTSGNISAPHDGAAIVAVVSEPIWTELGRPPSLRLVASARLGVPAAAEAEAPIAALRKLWDDGFDRAAVDAIETSESSAAQALALIASLGLDPDIVNPDGGALARGHPLGASGAVLVTRLFTHMVRNRGNKSPRFGVVTQGSHGGLGVAALFEAV
jgi:acetyl-CoA C-acetyltransferase